MPPAARAGPNSPAAPFELAAAGPGKLAAQGPLTFASARAAHELGLRVLAAAPGPELEIDCSAVSPADSAGLAVLLDWLGTARRSGRRLRFTRLPEGLRALARISELEELLERGA